jgi:hypothetical protein
MKIIKKSANKKLNFKERLENTIKELKATRRNAILNDNVGFYECTPILIEYFNTIDDDLKTNEIFIKTLLKFDPHVYNFLIDFLASRKSNDFLEKISFYTIERYPYIMREIPIEKQTRKMALKAVSVSADVFSDLKPEFREDREIVEKAVSNYGESIQYTSLINEKDIFLKALKNDGLTLKYATYEELEDFEIVSTAYLSDPSSIEYLNNQWIEYPDQLIALNFVGFIQLFAKLYPTETMEKIHKSLLLNKNKELALKAEQELNLESSLKNFFDKCNENNPQAISKAIIRLEPFLGNMFPFWKKESVETFLKFAENSTKNYGENKEAFNLLALSAKEQLTNKLIQEVNLKKNANIDSKKHKKVKQRKILFNH